MKNRLEVTERTHLVVGILLPTEGMAKISNDKKGDGQRPGS